MLYDRLNRMAVTLSDDELASAIRAAERCALCLTRTRRDLALMRLRCFRCELERRQAERQEPARTVTDA